MTTKTIHDYDPRAQVNGVQYALVMGDGYAPADEYGFFGPAYVWVAECDPDYTAPLHVSEACDADFQLGLEVAAAEFAAGWDPNP